jgi:putative transcriptional regulator
MEDLYLTGPRENNMRVGPGTLLIAPPKMTDGRFVKSVILVTHHNSAGTFALCLNKPTRNDLKEFSRDIGLDKELPFSLYWGGPVNQQSLWMIHDNNWENEHSMIVTDKWRVTSNESMFHHLADGDAPRNFRLVFGFCSWAPGQLEMELAGTFPFTRSSSWLILPNSNPEFVLETDPSKLWKTSVELCGQQAVNNWMA